MCDNPDNGGSVFADVLTSLVNSLSSNCSSNVSAHTHTYTHTHTHTHRDRPQLMLCSPINTERTKCTSQQSREIPVFKLALLLCELPLFSLACCVSCDKMHSITYYPSLSHQISVALIMKMAETEIQVSKLKVFILHLYFCLGLELLKLFILLLYIYIFTFINILKVVGAVL